MYRILIVLGFAIILAGGAWMAAIISGDQSPVAEGQIRLTQDESGNIILQPFEGQTGALQEFQHIAAGEEIPGQDTPIWRNYIDPGASYLVSQLPFDLEVRSFELHEPLKTVDQLTIWDEGHKETVEIVPGGDLKLGETHYLVTDIRKWTGILPAEDGQPMIAFSIKEPGETWLPLMVLQEDVLSRIGKTLGCELQWHESEDLAKAAAGQGIRVPQYERWGVNDNGTISWVRSFVPGTALRLSDGRVVRLVKRDISLLMRTTSLIVEIMDQGEKTSERIQANTGRPTSLVLYETPKLPAAFARFHCWTDGQALACAYKGEELVAQKVIVQGEEWRPDDLDLSIRLQAAIKSAVDITYNDSPFFAAYVQGLERALVIREGERVREGERSLLYERLVIPPKVTYHLTAHFDGQAEDLELPPVGSVNVAGWHLNQAPVDLRLEQTAFIHAQLPRDSLPEILATGVLGVGLIFVFVGAIAQAKHASVAS